ncbi:MAG: ketopantoate reductase C-terminal domain-containing protein, partial [Panacagrimonas sp.]
RRIYVAVLEETTGALDAARIRWKMPLVLPYGVYRWALLHGGPLPWWFAKYRNGVREGAYPSMVADVENGRVTEVEQLNGEVVRLGREVGYPTPANAALVSLIGNGGAPPRLEPSQLRLSIGVR